MRIKAKHTVVFDGKNTVIKCGKVVLGTPFGNHNFSILKCSHCGKPFTSIGSGSRKEVFDNAIQPAYWPREELVSAGLR